MAGSLSSSASDPPELAAPRPPARVVRTHPLSLPDGYMSAAALVAAGVPKALAAQLSSARGLASQALSRIRQSSRASDADADASAPAGSSARARTRLGPDLGPDTDTDDWADAGPALAAPAVQALPVAFSAWDTVAATRFLSFIYAHDATGAPGPATVWVATHNTFTQIANIPPSLLVAPGVHAEICALRITMRQQRLRLLAVVLAGSTASRSLDLVEFDPASASVVGSATISELQTASAAHQTSVHAALLHNNRYIVIGWSATSPAGRSATIAIHSAGDLAATRAPILDTAAPFQDRPPAFDLSGRLLAYASTSAPPYSDTTSSTLVGEEDPSGNILYQARTMGERMYHGASAGASGLAAALTATSPFSSVSPQQPRSAPAAVSSFLTTPPPRSGRTDHTTANSHTQVYSGTVHVVDLSRGTRSKAKAGDLLSASLISAFRAAPTTPVGGAGRLACVKFNPTGELLATADTSGHQFHIYALKMRPVTARMKAEDGLLRPEWLYVMYRGITSAQVAGMEWSADSRLLHVLTKRGTTHTFVLHPWGALPSAKECVTGRGTNAHAYLAHLGSAAPRPMPLAASAKTSSSIERFLPVPEGGGDPSAGAGQKGQVCDAPSDTQKTGLLPSGWPAVAVVHDTPGHEARRVGLYQFNASHGDVVQHELLLSAHRPRNLLAIPVAPRGGLYNSQAQHSLGTAYPRTSLPTTTAGRERGGLAGWNDIQSLRALARSEAPHALWRGLSRPDPGTNSTDTAVTVSPTWLVRTQGAAQPYLGLGEAQDAKLGTFSSDGGAESDQRRTTAAAAELHTYAKVPYAHATHVYLVPQLKFGAFAPRARADTDADLDGATAAQRPPLSACAAHMAPTVRTEVRIEPRVDPGELAMDDLADGLAAAATKADWAYNRPLGTSSRGHKAGANATGMAPYGHSRDVPMPSFPVGVPARSRTWAQHVSQGIPLGRFTAAAGVASAGAAAGLRAVSGAVGGTMGGRLNRAALTLGRSAPTGSSPFTSAADDMDDMYTYAALDPLDPLGSLEPPTCVRDRGNDTPLTVGSLDANRPGAIGGPACSRSRSRSRCGAHSGGAGTPGPSGLPQAQTQADKLDDFVDGGIDPEWNPAAMLGLELGRGSDVSFSDSDDHSGHSGSGARSTSASSRPLRAVKVADIGNWGDGDGDGDDLGKADSTEDDDEVAWAMARGAAVAAAAPAAVGEDDDDLGWDGLGLDLSPDLDLENDLDGDGLISLGCGADAGTVPGVRRTTGSSTRRTFLGPMSGSGAGAGAGAGVGAGFEAGAGAGSSVGAFGGRNTSLLGTSRVIPVDAPSTVSSGFASPAAEPSPYQLSSTPSSTSSSSCASQVARPR